jgi:cobalamin biosynthesis protein CbiD
MKNKAMLIVLICGSLNAMEYQYQPRCHMPIYEDPQEVLAAAVATNDIQTATTLLTKQGAHATEALLTVALNKNFLEMAYLLAEKIGSRCESPAKRRRIDFSCTNIATDYDDTNDTASNNSMEL